MMNGFKLLGIALVILLTITIFNLGLYVGITYLTRLMFGESTQITLATVVIYFWVNIMGYEFLYKFAKTK